MSKIKILRYFLVVFFIVILTLSYFVYRLLSFYNKAYKGSNSNFVQVLNQPPQKQEKQIFNILLLGYGGPGHDGAYLTDTIILAHIDKVKKQIILISIPRDLLVTVPHKQYGFIRAKINSLYQTLLFSDRYNYIPDEYKNSSPVKLLSEKLKTITGYEVDYYLAVDFAGFVKVVDTLGGISVKLDKPIEDFHYPVEGKENDLCGYTNEALATLEAQIKESPESVFPCRYERFYLPAGVNNLDGATALKLVRSRKGLNSGGDFGRAERQQKVIQAIVEKSLKLNIIPKIPQLLSDLEGKVSFDIPLTLIKQNLDEVYKFSEYQIKNIVLSTDNVLTYKVDPEVGYVLYPKTGVNDWGSVSDYIKTEIENLSATDSGSLQIAPVKQ
ncbi:MAG: hypothetical protein KatS3mg090_0351 [Patescibacteria group bacterium]|nr:MAG: hypothetical protein KatS3mg090_0351 [Patescibacteria group bacterium]